MRQYPSVCLTILLFSGALVATAQSSVPLPEDPHELATNSVQVPATPADRANAFALLERAKQNADMHMPGSAPFNMRVTFNASGRVNFTGPGTITELWFSGRQWRYDQTLANYAETRIGEKGRISAKGTNTQPMRVAMLRAAMFWPVGGNPSTSALRTAAATWNGRPVTCLLLSAGNLPSSPGRLWEETEYCVDNQSGLLQIYSRAPGTYVVYSYNGNIEFHGRLVPDQLTIYVNRESVLTGQVTIKDADPADAPSTALDAAMMQTMNNAYGLRFPMTLAPIHEGSIVKPVIVNTVIDTLGNVVEAEVSTASDPALAAQALELVQKAKFGQNGQWRQAYINVRFAPAQ